MFRYRWVYCLLVCLLVLTFSPAMLFANSANASATHPLKSGSSKPTYNPGPLYNQFAQAADGEEIRRPPQGGASPLTLPETSRSNPFPGYPAPLS